MGAEMGCQEIIEELKAQASEKYKANVIRMGIPEENSIGVAASVIRSFAKKIGKSQGLAFELWDTKYHEARMLSVLLMNPKATAEAEAERLLCDVASWDLCDHLCRNLFLKMKGRDTFITNWIQGAQLYKKRAAFVLIAGSVIHDKKLPDETVDGYLELIMQYSDDEREHVKKAASSALKEIGKKNFHYNEEALMLAQEWMERGSKAQRWIGKDVVKELETMVKAEGRRRLISANTRMGKETMEEQSTGGSG